MQSDGCFDALKIDHQKLRAQATCVGVTTTRVAIWDFNHNDQALMLPEAVRVFGRVHEHVLKVKMYIATAAGTRHARVWLTGNVLAGPETRSARSDGEARVCPLHRRNQSSYVDCCGILDIRTGSVSAPSSRHQRITMLCASYF